MKEIKNRVEVISEMRNSVDVLEKTQNSVDVLSGDQIRVNVSYQFFAPGCFYPVIEGIYEEEVAES